MKRFLAVLLACFLSFSAPAQVGGPIIGQGGCTNNCTFTGNTVITGGTITGTNVPYSLSQSAIPFIKLSSGSMGNNGAVTGLTALPFTYSGGAWAWFPAGAVAAGVPATASWLWFVGSSTTAGTVYNSTYTSGTPTMGTQTAFATTGPGAFTGSTSEVGGPTITIPAGAMGANGKIRTYSSWDMTNSAGAKTFRLRWSGIGGSALISPAATTQASLGTLTITSNMGVTNKQTTNPQGSGSGLGFTTADVAQTAIDTTASTTYLLTVQTAAAADNAIIADYSIEILYAP